MSSPLTNLQNPLPHVIFPTVAELRARANVDAILAELRANGQAIFAESRANAELRANGQATVAELRANAELRGYGLATLDELEAIGQAQLAELQALVELRANGQARAELRGYGLATVDELRAIGQAELAELEANGFDLNAGLNSVRNFFQSLSAPNSYLDKVGILANKTWRFINTNWDILALGVSLVALSCLINPAIGGSLLSITKQLSIGFVTGFTLTHFFGEQSNSYFERIRSMDPILQAAVATIATTIFAPIAPFMGGLIIGNHTYKHLN